MGIKIAFNGASISRPGAYSKFIVENLTGFPLQATGTVGIVGEAIGGQPRILDVLTQSDIQSAKARYKSGPIADALSLLVNPSKDPRIPNGASTIVVYKVNSSTQSNADLLSSGSVAQINVKSKNYGSDENSDNALVSAGSISDLDAVLQGSIAGPFTLAGGETLIIIANSISYTYTGVLSGAQSAAALVADLNNTARWTGGLKPVIASGTTTITLTIDTAVVVGGSKDYGYLFVNPACTLDTIIGVSGYVRGQKGSRVLTVKKGAAVETSPDLGGLDQLSILYTGTGTLATMTLSVVANQITLTTACTGAAADNLNVVLQDTTGNNKFTLQGLSDFLNGTGKYVSSVLGTNANQNANELDFYTAVEIRNAPLNLRMDIMDVVDYVNTFSSLIVATRYNNVYKDLGVIANPLFLTGATDGSDTNLDWVNAFEAFKLMRINVVVPLISTDIGSVTIDSVNAAAAAHAAWGWSTLGKSERSAFVSKGTSKANLKLAAQALNSGYVSIFGEQMQVLDRFGNLKYLPEWSAACIAAGLRCGAETGEPLTYKIVNVNDVKVADGSWSPKKDGTEMIDAGVTVIEPLDTGGFRILLGNTTYGVDPSFVWNRESVVQASGAVGFDLRQNLELVFTGTKARTGSAEAIANFIKARMSVYLAAEIIVGDDDNGKLGFKNLKVLIQGNQAIINVSITPVQGIDFILPTIFLSDIRQSA